MLAVAPESPMRRRLGNFSTRPMPGSLGLFGPGPWRGFHTRGLTRLASALAAASSARSPACLRMLAAAFAVPRAVL